jgi:hypothetical protein
MSDLLQDLQKHFSADIVDMCFIGPDFLDRTPTRTVSACEQRSSQEIARFFAEHPVVASYQLLESRRIHGRALLFATEILGTDRSLTDEQLTEKSAMHLLMSVQMTLQWLIDDTLDVDASVDGEVARRIIEYYLALLGSSNEAPGDGQLLQAECSRCNIPGTFVEVVRHLAEWQRVLTAAVNVSLHPSSLYGRINGEFMRAFLQAHARFGSPERYFDHRAVNCGLCLEILCGAYWFCRLWGVDTSELDSRQDHYAAMLYEYSLLGGLSNDLFGYDKDLEEKVATSVEIIKEHHMNRLFEGDEERATTQAFVWLIDFYNEGLTELLDRCRFCDSPLERAILMAALTTTWATCVLHHQFMAIYRPQSLRKVLTWPTAA